VPFPQHYPPTHKCLFRNLVLGRAWEYSKTTHALAPFSPTPTSFDTTLTLTALHFNLDGNFSFFLKDYEPNQDLELSSNSFKLTFQRMPHLLASGRSRMVFEHL
jgi:hypothetical protein